jgi:hypothetical protein
MMLTELELELLSALVEEEIFRIEESLAILGKKDNTDIAWLCDLQEKLIALKIHEKLPTGHNVDNSL